MTDLDLGPESLARIQELVAEDPRPCEQLRAAAARQRAARREMTDRPASQADAGPDDTPRDPDRIAWAKSWFENMPEPWRKIYESMKARRNTND
jgi:hypothetical protein